MDILFKYGVYFCAGLIVSLISTFNIKSIAHAKAYSAAMSSFVSIMVSTFVVIDIITNIKELGYFAVFLYAIGFATGNFIITRQKEKGA